MAVASVRQALTSIFALYSQGAVVLTWFGAYLEFTKTVSGVSPSLPAGSLTDGITFEHVWFSYPGHAAWALRDVSLTIQAGQRVAVVGANGAGKTTLVQLLLRLYDPVRGRILWDGVDIRTFDPGTLRRRIALVLQDRIAYEMTALDAISLGDIDHFGDLDAARSAAAFASADDFIDRLPRGYDTMLSSGRSSGTTLSGGQWQRISVARSMMRTAADLYIMDEPNSGLDPVAEEALHQRLLEFGRGTCVLVSHRLGAVRHADTIHVLDAGGIVESGTHTDLMKRYGLYHTMFRAQADALTSADV